MIIERRVYVHVTEMWCSRRGCVKKNIAKIAGWCDVPGSSRGVKRCKLQTSECFGGYLKLFLFPLAVVTVCHQTATAYQSTAADQDRCYLSCLGMGRATCCGSTDFRGYPMAFTIKFLHFQISLLQSPVYSSWSRLFQIFFWFYSQFEMFLRGNWMSLSKDFPFAFG